jgi:hypothetical protein
MEIAGGLSAIAVSRTDAGFTNAVFAMCNPARRVAAPVVGTAEVETAANVQAGQGYLNATPQERAQIVALFQSFANTLVSIPARCDQAQAQMAQSSVEEQQAEVQHQANVNRALIAAGVLFAGTALVAGEVGAAAATRPPVTNNSIYVNQYNRYGY